MLKPFTLSLSLAAAFALCGISQAGGLFHGETGCSTCGIASPQGSYVSPQSVVASPQGEYAGCNDGCGEKKKCALLSKMNGCFTGLCAKMKPKPKCYTYEWVLKKKRVKSCGGCASPTCETCSSVYPSGQGVYTSPQGGYSSPQAGYGSPQAGYTSPQAGYSSGQIAVAPTSMMATPAPSAAGDEAPPAPEVAPAAPAPPAPSIPAPPAAPAPAGPMSSLLFSTPSGN